ncbi:predicted protein [Francisella philomiragia subsp. philomiragia ATCC 25015]|nr:predicted protein [Francisella philomiragia subsp. philomiragia ATCC 25015]
MHKKVDSCMQIRRQKGNNFSTVEAFGSGSLVTAMFSQKIKSQSNSSQALLSLSTKLLCL